MILVDTSIWIDHLRKRNPRLPSLLQEEEVLCHPFVIGEIACGNLGNRSEILQLLSALPRARIAEHDDVLHLLETRRLFGRGLGWIDAHLLASALLTRCAVWTRDTAMGEAAETLGISA